MLINFLALLIFQGAHYSVVVCTLNQHSFIWDTGELVVDFVVGEFELDSFNFLEMVARQVSQVKVASRNVVSLFPLFVVDWHFYF